LTRGVLHHLLGQNRGRRRSWKGDRPEDPSAPQLSGQTRRSPTQRTWIEYPTSIIPIKGFWIRSSPGQNIQGKGRERERGSKTRKIFWEMNNNRLSPFKLMGQSMKGEQFTVERREEKLPCISRVEMGYNRRATELPGLLPYAAYRMDTTWPKGREG